jgi:hypothetical protein
MWAKARAPHHARLAVGCAILVLSFVSERGAFATGEDDKVACANAYTEGQRLRSRGALISARDKLRSCTRSVCTKLQADCVQWVGDLDRAIPSVVLRAVDGSGKDLEGVQVKLDDKLMVDHLDGRAIDVDPGAHVFRFEGSSMVPADVHIVLGEGEKARSVLATMRRPGLSQEPDRARPPQRSEYDRPIPWPAFLFGGIGTAGLVSFGYFGLSGRAESMNLESCGRSCSPSDVSATREKLVLADVSLGISVLALAAAAYVVLTRPVVAVPRPSYAGR